MSVAVAHTVSPTGFIALREAGREARLRGTDLVVIHVVESSSSHLSDDYRVGLTEEIDRVLKEAGYRDAVWRLQLVTVQDSVSRTILAVADEVGAELLVIGARRRPPGGTSMLGDLAQDLILGADIPVLVAKPSAPLSQRH